MKNLLQSICALFITLNSIAQSYNSYSNALGIRVETGNMINTYTGLSVKHFFRKHSAAEAQILFGKYATLIGVEYQYHGSLLKQIGLKWYSGIGPALTMSKVYIYDSNGNYYGSDSQNNTSVRASVGLDFTVPDIPLNLSLDWRPAFGISSAYGSSFSAVRFGMAFRYAFHKNVHQ